MSALLLALALACAPSPPPPAEARDPALAALDADLRAASLTALEDARLALAGRDDLFAVDRRRALDLAWRNRSPAQVDPDRLDGVPEDLRARERALRLAWQEEHVAFSWDNLDPEAQLGPRPERLSLTWLALAHALPLARNHRPFAEPWVADAFERKTWYLPEPGPLSLSMIDKVQMEQVEAEVAALTPEILEAWRAAQPAPGMSPAEARIEGDLAARLLAGGTIFSEEPP